MRPETPTPERLAEEIRRLARENRRIRRMLAALAVAAALVIATCLGCSQPAPTTAPFAGQAKAAPGPASRVVEAEKFILRDASGRMRAELVSESAGTGLVLYDEQGKPRAALNLTASGGGLSILGADGKMGVGIDQRGEVLRLVFTGGNGATRAGIVVTGTETGLDLFDLSGRVLFSKP